MATTKKEKRVLLICESPNKIKTLKQILPDNYIVMASVGHITHIADSGEFNMGIDTKNDFKADFRVIDTKKDVVKKLKEQVKAADEVILFTDGDREGEAISYHLKEQLKIPESKYKRAAVHEITKKAVLAALENPRKIDYDLVSAATSRQKADKIIGYRLSSIARNNVGAKSVGRCQSAGLKLIAMREDEITSFVSETYFDLYLKFAKNNTEFKAKYSGYGDQQVKNLPSLEACKKVVDACKNSEYKILDIAHKDSLENPKPPFTTSTFQQEVSKKLGISVKNAMECAQRLFEGIDVGGSHISLITYIRTDDASYAPEFLPVLEEFVRSTYGDNYYAPVKFGKKGENSQEGHEGIRCIDLTMTPARLSQYIHDEKLLKVYSIIYNRTVASAMKPAIIANTIYIIENNSHLFNMTSKELKFDGYKRVYAYSDESNDDEIVKETFEKGEVLQDTSLEAIEKQTKPPARFDESGFIKELDKQGIGRPSTYATIVQVLLDEKRGYCKLEDKRIVPTELGMKLSRFLDNSFSDIINIKYTAELEKELDLIARGEMDGIDFLSQFYQDLEASINKVDPTANSAGDKQCPNCGRKMGIRKGRYGMFWGCTGYPECKTIEPLKPKA